jgi:hypothetical protein
MKLVRCEREAKGKSRSEVAKVTIGRGNVEVSEWRREGRTSEVSMLYSLGRKELGQLARRSKEEVNLK